MPRADLQLVARGLTSSRTAARRLIEAGRLFHFRGGERLQVKSASQDLPESAELEIEPDPADCYVSRGGLKLAGALAHSQLNVSGYSCLDIGQSTGGFTDCLLQAGAARVIGVEVGHGQLHPKLATDPRTVCLEGVNARHLTPADLGEDFPDRGFDLIVTDASFISLTLLLPQFPGLLRPPPPSPASGGGHVLALVKPQFEVGPKGLGKGGIVRDASRYAEVEAKIRAACAEAGLIVVDYFDSPITGADGNREFFVLAARA
jgi:23S rRNA (cytidine1920-2'-O)/16S rRNA (cytidine1409-2'-O)-methyltransferase